MGKSYFKFVERFYGYGLSPSSYIACTFNEYSFKKIINCIKSITFLP